MLTSPLNVGAPVCVLASPFRLLSGPVEWREWCVLCCPCLGLGPPLHIVLAFLALSCPSRIVQSPSSFCVCCHSIVGLGLCLCGRVVSLWNGGGGLCWVGGRLLSTVYTSSVCGVHLSDVCVVMGYVMTVYVLSCRVVLWVVEWRCVRVCVVSLFVFFVFFSFSFSPFVVGVRGSARAALRARTLSPNTIVFPCLFLSFSPLFPLSPFFTASPFFCWNGGG